MNINKYQTNNPEVSPDAPYKVPVRQVLFICLAFCTIGMTGVAVLVQVLEVLFGWDRSTIIGQLTVDSPMEEVWKLRLVAGLNQALVFLAPGIVTVWVLRRMAEGLYKSTLRSGVPHGIEVLYGTILLVVSMPFVLYTLELNRLLPIPDSMRATAEAAASTVRALLQMPSWLDLLANLLLIGVIPAIGEELLFRGILQGQLMRKWSPWVAILISAAVFSFVHFQMDGFLPRWLLGILLGWLFWKTSNFWVPVFVHFLNNGVQVLGAYFVRDAPELLDLEQRVEVPIGLALVSFSLTVYLFWYWDRRLGLR
jgi:hypothetical protein